MAIAPRTASELLRDVKLLKELPTETLSALAEASEVRKTAKGAPFFTSGNPAEGLWIVRTGEVKITKGGTDGREQILYLARPGKAIVEGIRFDGGKYPASSVAMRAASAIVITNDVLKDIGRNTPALFETLLDMRAMRSDRTLALVSDLSLRTVPSRLASFLCTLITAREKSGQDAENLVRDLTTETVAGRLGTVREEISRGLAHLERKGALSVSPDLIEVVDVSILEEIAYGTKK